MRLTTRNIMRTCWGQAALRGEVPPPLFDAGAELIDGNGAAYREAAICCEDAIAMHARKLGYRGAIHRQRRSMRGILAWLRERLASIDWVALAKIIIPIILALLSL